MPGRSGVGQGQGPSAPPDLEVRVCFARPHAVHLVDIICTLSQGGPLSCYYNMQNRFIVMRMGRSPKLVRGLVFLGFPQPEGR